MSLENKLKEKRAELSRQIEELQLRIKHAEQRVNQWRVEVDQMVGGIIAITEILDAEEAEQAVSAEEMERKLADLTENAVK